MDYYLSTVIENHSFDQVEKMVSEKLKEKGFGVVSHIDISATLKNRIGAELQPYTILGACSPNHAFALLSKIGKAGVFLPCNVCIKQLDDQRIEVFSINPSVAMQSMNAPEVEHLAVEISTRLQQVLDELPSD